MSRAAGEGGDVLTEDEHEDLLNDLLNMAPPPWTERAAAHRVKLLDDREALRSECERLRLLLGAHEGAIGDLRATFAHDSGCPTATQPNMRCRCMASTMDQITDDLAQRVKELSHA